MDYSLLTRWGKNIQRESVLPEYPRPGMQRKSYLNLNGEWDYAIYPDGQNFSGYSGKILVPFSPESLLSGVHRVLMPNETLYYRRKIYIDESFIHHTTLLHFGAVDYECRVSVNGTFVGQHRGGYFPFHLDISRILHAGENEITLEVKDPSDTSFIARGKQTLKRGGIWYTPQSGIWQTVWMESLPEVYIQKIWITPDIDHSGVYIHPITAGDSEKISLKIYSGGILLQQKEILPNSRNFIILDKPILWSPENPHLYDMELSMREDHVTSYFGMRKISLEKDKKGIPRLFLNNHPYFHNGLLDQGYWSDGMMTAPSDDAIIFDITQAKNMGFNMLRKHIKMEPLRWYYHCDRIGMLVWQDMINGGSRYKFRNILLYPFILGMNITDSQKNYSLFSRENPEGRDEYWKDLDSLISHLYNQTSLVVWVPHNEGWGQFDANRAVEFVRAKDPTRLVDHASGWHDQGGGDMKSLHIYFRKFKMRKKYKDKKRATVLSEFGGYSFPVSGHHTNKETFGYGKFKDREAFQIAFNKLYESQIIPALSEGLSATVYTQIADVEDETNGLFTYDREILKVDPIMTSAIHSRIQNSFLELAPRPPQK